MPTALLLIDVQDHWSSANPKTTEAIREAVPYLRRLMPVIWVYMDGLHAHKQPYEMKGERLFHAFEEAMQPAIMPAKEDFAFLKVGNDVFYSTPRIAGFLREQGVSDVVVGGFMGNKCVLATAQGAIENGFKASVLKPLTSDTDDEFTPWMYGHDKDIRLLDKGELERLKNQAVIPSL